jgi:hypothetical protein
MQMHKAGTILSLVNPLQHISSPLQRRSTRQLCVCVKAWRTAGESDSQVGKQWYIRIPEDVNVLSCILMTIDFIS